MLDNQILFYKSSQISMRRLKKKFNFLTIFWLFKNWDASISQRNWNKKVLMLKTRVRWPKFIIQTKKKHFGNNLNLTKMTPSWGTVPPLLLYLQMLCIQLEGGVHWYLHEMHQHIYLSICQPHPAFSQKIIFIGPRSPGPIYVSGSLKLSERRLWNFTDMTLADEDTNLQPQMELVQMGVVNMG